MAQTKPAHSLQSPLEELALALSGGMDSVNAHILRHMQSDIALIPQLAGYLISSGGKRIRPLMTLASATLYDEKPLPSSSIAAAVELIHTATLLHDDVVDESTERRGRKSANIVFGNQASVLVGDFLFSRAFQLMVESGSLPVLRILSNAAAVIAEGEVLQMTIAKDIETTLEQYLNVIHSKTAALFSAACEAGPLLAGADAAQQSAMAAYGYNLGMAFQIADDILDYSADRGALGKNTGDDFREGKITAPVFYALENATDNEQIFWRRTLSEGDQQPEDFARALDILNAHKSIDRARSLAATYAAKARDALNAAPESKMKNILAKLADYAVERQS